MNRGAYGPPRNLGPGDLGLRELADEEDREDRDTRRRERDEAAADAYMAGDWQDED